MPAMVAMLVGRLRTSGRKSFHLIANGSQSLDTHQIVPVTNSTRYSPDPRGRIIGCISQNDSRAGAKSSVSQATYIHKFKAAHLDIKGCVESDAWVSPRRGYNEQKYCVVSIVGSLF